MCAGFGEEAHTKQIHISVPETNPEKNSSDRYKSVALASVKKINK